jgi:hypothetical protein
VTSDGGAQLTLYGRRYCHLCDDMLAALEALRGEFAFTVTVIDVDTDAVALASYDELVPVLVAEGGELCHYFFEHAKVREYLVRFALESGLFMGSARC